MHHWPQWWRVGAVRRLRGSARVPTLALARVRPLLDARTKSAMERAPARQAQRRHGRRGHPLPRACSRARLCRWLALPRCPPPGLAASRKLWRRIGGSWSAWAVFPVRMACARRFVCSTTAFSESVCFLQITPEECMSLATAANGLPGTVLGEGARPVIIAGVKYMVLRADENVFYVRQVGLSSWPRPRSANPCLGCLCRASPLRGKSVHQNLDQNSICSMNPSSHEAKTCVGP